MQRTRVILSILTALLVAAWFSPCCCQSAWMSSEIAGWVAGADEEPGCCCKAKRDEGPRDCCPVDGTNCKQSGAKLATATFVNETASGWQQVTLMPAVQISANTTYVASYHAPNGGFSKNEGYFATTGADGGPLHAPSSPAAGGNGVFRFGASGFPDQTYNASNYWVDIVFTMTAP